MTISIPSNNPPMCDPIVESMRDTKYKTKIVDGTSAPGYSYLVNKIIKECPDELVIICNDKCRPTESDVDRGVGLIEQGFGWVGLYNFGFTLFKKDVVRRIGLWDEGFLGGGYEDIDYLRRLSEGDIGPCIYSKNIPYIEGPTTWHQINSYDHYVSKWEDIIVTPYQEAESRRLKPESKETMDHKLGDDTGEIFHTWDKAQIEWPVWYPKSRIIKSQ